MALGVLLDAAALGVLLDAAALGVLLDAAALGVLLDAAALGVLLDAAAVGFLLDVEGSESFRGFGLDGDCFHDGQAGAGVGPVNQASDMLGRALEDRFDPAIG